MMMKTRPILRASRAHTTSPGTSPGTSRFGRAPLALAVTCALLLAACSSGGPRSAGPAARADPGMPAQGARRGGYYLDDGPGNGPVPDIAAIPDATPRAEPLHPRANRPYVVFERQYTPMTALLPYRERGVGSWYGRRYHGQRTSSGEVYDMYAMTAAHPTLPIPSYVRVTSTVNGRSVVVRVNDRGPFLHGRVIDLSYTAAAKLGYAGGGSAEVDVELITRFDAPAEGTLATSGVTTASAAVTSAATSTTTTATVVKAAMPSTAGVATTGAGASSRAASVVADASAPRLERLDLETVVAPSSALAPRPASPSEQVATRPAPVLPADSAALARPATSGSHFLQLAAFATRENAESSRARLARDLDWLADRLQVRQEDGMFKVHAGPYRQRDEALSEAERIRQATAFKPFPVAR